MKLIDILKGGIAVGMLFVLSACGPCNTCNNPQSNVPVKMAPIQLTPTNLPDELADCKVYWVKIVEKYPDFAVMRCPTTTTTATEGDHPAIITTPNGAQ